MLLTVYLTTIYTTILSFTIDGNYVNIIDDIVVGVLAAWFWLRWKIKTEYISPAEFQKTTEKYRNDFPS
jgi:hypothetical protein